MSGETVDTNGLPDFLKSPSNHGHKYGRLEFKGNRFVITGEPVLLEFAKRIFPGCTNWRRSGPVVTFGRSTREVSDLNWIMMRFPLEIECRDQFDEAMGVAVDKWTSRIHGTDMSRTTPPVTFSGKLFSYQEKAVTFLTKNKRALLGDSMGLGKTWSSLGAVAQSGSYPVLVVCQTQVQIQWQRAIGELMSLDCDYEKELCDTEIDVAIKRGEALSAILKGRTPYDIPDVPFTIIHYGLLGWWDKALIRRVYPTVIFDEVQELRHSGTFKYSAASLISGEAENVWGLSGSPVFGYGAEIWSVMNALDFHCLGSREAFTREWCTGYGEKIVSMPKALNGHLTREGLLLRRRNAEVQPDIPCISRIVQDLQQDDSLYEDLVMSARKRAKEWSKASFAEKGKIAREVEGTTRRAAGVAKAGYVAEFVSSLIEAGEKPLVYAWHHKVHNILRERLAAYNPVFITGKQSPKEKDKGIRSFLRGESDVVILSLRSAAGIDGLQHRATCCAFAELDWSPAVFSQCETRVARIGVSEEVKDVPSYYCVSRSGFDEVMLDVLGVKTGQFVEIMGDEPEDFEEKKLSEQRAISRIRQLIEKLGGDVQLEGT